MKQTYVYRKTKAQKIHDRYILAFKIFILVLIAVLLTLIIIAKISHQTYYTDTYLVQSGDTLWEIADAYAPDSMDYHEYINTIKEDNDLSNNIIHPGQRLKIRIYE